MVGRDMPLAPESAPPRRRWWLVPWVAVWLSITLAFAFLGTCLLILPRYRRERFGTRWALIPWAGFSVWWARVRLQVLHAERLPTAREGFLVAANHESLYDIPVLGFGVGRPFLMKQSLLSNPIGWAAYAVGCVGVARGTKASREHAMTATLAMAQRAVALTVFPEGTFGAADGALGSPHLNLLRHAYDAGVPVLPTGHAGTRRVVDGDTLSLALGIPVALVVGELVRPTDFASREQFATACWDRLAAAVTEARAQVPSGWPYAHGPLAAGSASGRGRREGETA